MATSHGVLSDLRRRLNSLQAQQRTRGGAASPEFLASLARRPTHDWAGCLGASGPSEPSEPSEPSARPDAESEHGSEQGAGAPGPSTQQSSTQQSSTQQSSTQQSSTEEPSAAKRRRRPSRARTHAPAARVANRGAGPWANVPADVLEGVEPRSVGATTDADMDDPAWLDSVCATIEDSQQRGPQPSEPTPVMAEAVIGMSLHRHDEGELSRTAEWISHQRASLDVMLVNVLSELAARGVEPPAGLSRSDWLRAHDPTLTAGAAKALVTVATALGEVAWARLRMLVSTQQVTVAKAAQIIEFESRTRPVADADDFATALKDVTDQASLLRPEELAALIRHHTEQIKPPLDEDRLDEGRRQARGLWFGQPSATGMVNMRATLDPEAAAIVKSAIDPLSMPCPTKNRSGHTTTPDPRTPAKRRADALIDLISRAVSAPDGTPTTDKAKVVVLLDYETLVGHVRGAGRTLSGDVLSPETIRRIACDAEIIPMVLGTKGEPLDVGRSKRLVTKGLRLALIARDGGCSFPGCSMPPQWTDAHHTVHWSRGGATSLLTTALLCSKHHTHVHRYDLTATVTATSVTWHV